MHYITGAGADMCAQVCRAAGYFEHALAVAQAAGEPEWYLDILLEDCNSYDEALVYLQSLPRQQAAVALGRHGKVVALALSVLLSFLCLFSGSGLCSASTQRHAFQKGPMHNHYFRINFLIILCHALLTISASERALILAACLHS